MPLVLDMLTANAKFRNEKQSSKTTTGVALFQIQEGHWILIGYHSKKLLQAVHNYDITGLEVIGLVCNIHSFSHFFNILILMY